ncbi:hypothetical protein [Moraxella bovis]|uniref:Uncharacterized protein n=1 Tax=Moraxella bovis TaxID=476 RepID=A0A378PPS4_MORBO|nr:hypothetical protein [Moraxella bovis]STY90535.1 Uncharacterised protein [Moraxella bovis]
MQSNHTQLLTLTNNRLTHLFKQNGNDKRFMAEFPYKLDQVEKHWQINEYYIKFSTNDFNNLSNHLSKFSGGGLSLVF